MATCGEMWQQTGEEEVEVEGIDGVEVVVVEVREGIVAERVDTTAPHTMMINDEHPAGVVGLPWVGAEHQAVAQVTHTIYLLALKQFELLENSPLYHCKREIVQKS